MTTIVSTVLFGDNFEKYAVYLPTFALAHHNLFHDFEWWVAVDERLQATRWAKFLLRLMRVDLVRKLWLPKAPPLTLAMLHRLMPVFAIDATYVFCRDLDALPMPRDRACMDEFILSGFDMHVVHDNPQHMGLMGGMFGCRAPRFRAAIGLNTFQDLLRCTRDDEPWERHGTDQNVMNRLFDVKNGPSLLEHRYNGWENGPHRRTPHPAGKYRCAATSTPTPSYPKTKFSQADYLAPHIGCADYDHVAARAWWEKHGDPQITQLVRKCEERL